MTNQSEQSAKNAHYPEPDYTHPDEMPIVEQRPNPHSDLRGTIVHFTSEMLDNPNNYGIYPTTNFYNDLEEALTSLIKDLVTEAKPTRSETQIGNFIIYGDLSKRDLNIIDQFEQNILKALEEV